MTTVEQISQSIADSHMRDAHRLYDAALQFTSLAPLFRKETLRAVSDRLALEAGRGGDVHETDVLEAMAFYLAMELASHS